MSLDAKLKVIGTVTRRRGPGELLKRIAKLIYSNAECYVLRRDLTRPLEPRPEAKIPISFRAVQPSDMAQIVAEGPSGLLLGILRSGLPQCYVAVTENQEICYMQFLIQPEDRERIRAMRFRQMHAFDDDTVMLEFAYTFKRFRGLGIMSPSMAWIAEQDPQARWAVTYVDRGNVASLRGCRAAGFYPHLLTYDKWRLFRLSESVGAPKSLEAFWTREQAIRGT